ncbi:MAG: IPTL-CTERM sorting domain-containing protein [Acidovorax sp.]|nr:IPTL-CTERM sorting domain-containing protein [Acidovorax sp.]
MPTIRSLPAALLLAGLFCTSAGATTFVVNDDGDAPLDAVVNCNGGANPCTLRAAIQAVNANPFTPHAIHFNFSGGPALIQPGSALPAITRPVAIDGYALGAGNPNTLLEGDNASIAIRIDGANIAASNAHGLHFFLGSSGSSVRGLAITRFDGNGIRVDGQNVANGVTDITIAGNFIGTDGSGTGGDETGGLANHGPGIYIWGEARGNTVGGGSPADRNLIVGSSANPNSPAVYIRTAPHNLVQGNYIGTDRAGNSRRGTLAGVVIAGGLGSADHNAVQGNVIGATSVGVQVAGDITDTIIQGNRVGLGTGGASIAGSQHGIFIVNGASTGPQAIRVGGTSPGEANTIAHWSGNGIRVEHNNAAAPDLHHHSFLGNSIYANNGPGIALVGSPASTVNSGQGAPVIQSATGNAQGTVATFSFTGTPNSTQRFEVFANGACTPQGRTYLGAVQLVTDASGNASGSINLPALANPADSYLSMTATSLFSGGGGETSSFSACMSVAGGPTGPVGPGSPAAIPTLDHAGLALLSAVMAGLGALRRRRQR